MSRTGFLAALTLALAVIPTSAALLPSEAACIQPATTRLTFAVATCEGCRVRLSQGVFGTKGKPTVAWQSPTRTVRNGRVSFVVPTTRTVGLSAAVVAPWEGETGFVSQVAWHYGHEPVGTRVKHATARTRSRGSGCWAGTSEAAVTIPLKVRREYVEGNSGRSLGTLAWAGVMQPWRHPVQLTSDGVLASQTSHEVLFCNDF